MMIFARYQALVGTALLLLASSEGFSSEAVARPSNSSPLQIPTKRLPSALEQAVLVPDGDLLEDPSPNVLERIRNALPSGTSRGGAAAVVVVEEKPKGESFLKRHPFLSAVAITTTNAVVADLLTQLVFEAMPWNPKRSLVFGAFGFHYQGMVQYAIVNLVWEKVFPGTSPKAVISKICAMNLLSDPLFFMPTFYIFQEALTTGTVGWATVKAALLAYKGNCLMDWRNSWMVWFPGHAVTYGVMPTHKRIPWMAFLSFFYMCVLSITRGAV